MTTRELLERGLSNIREYGWRQGSFGNCRDGYCAMGALQGSGYGDVAASAYRALRGQTGADELGVWAWNDYPGRTQPEVEALYERAIAATEDSA